MNLEAMLHPPEGYLTIRCVAGIGSFPNNIKAKLHEAGVDTAIHFGNPPEMVLVAEYWEIGSQNLLHLVADLRCEVDAGEAVALTLHPVTGLWGLSDVPPEFRKMIQEAQLRPF